MIEVTLPKLRLLVPDDTVAVTVDEDGTISCHLSLSEIELLADMWDGHESRRKFSVSNWSDTLTLVGGDSNGKLSIEKVDEILGIVGIKDGDDIDSAEVSKKIAFLVKTALDKRYQKHASSLSTTKGQSNETSNIPEEATGGTHGR
jgi:hypothetical protein